MNLVQPRIWIAMERQHYPVTELLYRNKNVIVIYEDALLRATISRIFPSAQNVGDAVEYPTGVSDKRGTMIYEGDRVEGDWDEKDGWIVYDNARFSIQTRNGMQYKITDWDLEIIGNIHEEKP